MISSTARVKMRNAKTSQRDGWSFGSTDDARAFLEELYALRQEPRRAVRRVFEFMDNALLDNRRNVCDAVLQMADPARLDLTTATGLLAITLQAQDILVNRNTYYQRIKQWLVKENPEELDAILAGLK